MEKIAMKATPSLTADRLREVLHYDPETGVFTWKVKTCRKVIPGSVAGRLSTQGHRYIGLFGQSYLATRLAWLYVYREWPDRCVVHLNYVTDDNRIANLRLSERHSREAPITADLLRDLLDYDPETGAFTWKVRNGICFPGDKAGAVNKHRGYEYIGLANRRLLSHRLAWLYVYGEWPEGQIDHINRVKTDNRIANLRLATQSENGQNTKLSRSNKSGHKGVIWYKRDQNWRAFLTIEKKVLHLGYFQNLDDAVAARKAAEAQYHPFAQQVTHHA